MIEIVKANQRRFSDREWLQTYWLFSFASYYDPRNIRFGALRVFNDDVVQPGEGFPTHPHEEMEIITVVLDGEITHADSMGNKAVIRAGDVQRMSTGTGLTHSEFNIGESPVHFYQIWLFPDQAGLAHRTAGRAVCSRWPQARAYRVRSPSSQMRPSTGVSSPKAMRCRMTPRPAGVCSSI